MDSKSTKNEWGNSSNVKKHENSKTLNFIAPFNRVGFGIYSLMLYLKLYQWSEIYDLVWYPIGNPDPVELEKTLRQFRKELHHANLAIESIKFGKLGTENPANPNLIIWHPHEIGKYCTSKKKNYAITHFETDGLTYQEIDSMKKAHGIASCSEWGNSVLIQHGITVMPELAPIVVYESTGPGSIGAARHRDLAKITDYCVTMYPGTFIMSGGKFEGRKAQDLQIGALEIKYIKPITLFAMWHNVFTGGLAEPMKYLHERKWDHIRTLKTEENMAEVYQHPVSKNTIVLFDRVKHIGDVFNLHYHCDFYLCTSAGEGLNQPLVEAMQRGIMPICTWNTAHKRYLFSDCFIDLSCTIETANDGVWFKGNRGNWYPTGLTDVVAGIHSALNIDEETLREIQVMNQKNIASLNEDKKFIQSFDKCIGALPNPLSKPADQPKARRHIMLAKPTTIDYQNVPQKKKNT